LIWQCHCPKSEAKYLTAIFLIENMKMFAGKSKTSILMKNSQLALIQKLEVCLRKVALIVPIFKFQSCLISYS